MPVSIFNVDDRTGQPVIGRESNHEPVHQANQKFPKTNPRETMTEWGNPLSADSGTLSEITEWLQEFREVMKFLNAETHIGPREVRIWVSTVFVLTSLLTDIARSARGPKLQGLRAEDAMAEPYFVQKISVTVVVQDLATQWIQSYPCKTKISQETLRSLPKFLEPDRNPKVIYTDNSLEFGKACEDLSWNHCTSTPHRSETNGIVERAVRRVKEGTSAVLLQSSPNESWWADSTECYTYLRNVTDLLSDGKTPHERRFGQLFKGHHSIWFTGRVSPHNREGPVENPPIWKDSLTLIVPRIRSVRGGELGRVTY